MRWDTKVLIWLCLLAVLFGIVTENVGAVSGFVVAFLGWLAVGLKERREVK